MKILYIFSGERKKAFDEISRGLSPDTQLYGYNHITGGDLIVETKEFQDVYPTFLNKILGFRIKHFLMYFITPKYDVVFGASILYFMIFKRLFRSKTKYVLLNISLNRLLISHKNKKLNKWFIDFLLGGVDAIVCLSHYQLDQLNKIFGIDSKKLFYIPLGVDDVYHKPIYTGRKNYILSVGRDNGRDYKTVIEVAKKLHQYEFEIVCSSRNMKGIVYVPDNVKVIFDISKKDLKKKYEEAKVLLLLTHGDDYNDGADCSGQTVLLDAAASGLPIVATRKAYIDDYFTHGKDILLSHVYSVDSVVDNINKMEDDSFRMSIAQSARKRVEESFSTLKMSRNLEDLFRKIVKK